MAAIIFVSQNNWDPIAVALSNITGTTTEHLRRNSFDTTICGPCRTQLYTF